MNRDTTLKNTRVAKVAACALIAAAGIVAFAPIWGNGGSKLVASDIPVPALKRPTALADSLPVDPAELGRSLNLTAPAVVVAPKPPPPVATAEPVPATPPPPPPPVWRFIGAILTEMDKRAIVTVNDRQRVVAVGDTVDGSRVKDISVEWLKVVEADGTEKQIDRAPTQVRQLSVAKIEPTVATGAAGAAAAAALAKGTPGPDGGPPPGMSATQWSMMQQQKAERDAKMKAIANQQAGDPAARTRMIELQKALDGKQMTVDDFRKQMTELPRSAQMIELDNMLDRQEIDQETYIAKMQAIISAQSASFNGSTDRVGKPR